MLLSAIQFSVLLTHSSNLLFLNNNLAFVSIFPHGKFDVQCLAAMKYTQMVSKEGTSTKTKPNTEDSSISKEISSKLTWDLQTSATRFRENLSRSECACADDDDAGSEGLFFIGRVFVDLSVEYLPLVGFIVFYYCSNFNL